MLFVVPLVVVCTLYLSYEIQLISAMILTWLIGWFACWCMKRFACASVLILVSYSWVCYSVIEVKNNIESVAGYLGEQTIEARIDKRWSDYSYLITVLEPYPIRQQQWILSVANTNTYKLGDSWRMQVRVSPIRSIMNIGSLHSEKRWLPHQIVAKAKLIQLNEKISDHFSVEAIRQYLIASLSKQVAAWQHHELMLAVVFGDKSKINRNIKTTFMDLGISHLLAVSGMHVGIWLLMVKRVLQSVFGLRKNTYRYGLISMIFYAWLAGFLPPITRVLAMVWVSYIYKRYVGHITWMSVALIVLSCALLYQPFLVYDPSFCLSYLATFLIIYMINGYPFEQSSWQIYWRLQWAFFIGFIPVNLFFFGQVAWLSWPVNIWMVPWATSWLIPMTLIVSLLMLLCPSWITLFPLQFVYEHSWNMTLMLLAFFERQIPPPIPMLEHSSFNLCLLSIGAWLTLLPKAINYRYWGLCVLAFWFLKPAPMNQDSWTITMLDVGQGLSLVIQTANHLMVFDTGPASDYSSAAEKYLIPYLRYWGHYALDLLVISHGDNDHSGGLEALTRYFPVKEFISGEPKRLITTHQVLPCQEGMAWQFDQINITVMAPLDNEASHSNDRSCVIKIHDGDHQVLLTGDMSQQLEEQLVDRYQSRLKSDIVVVPHHGSYYSSSIRFIQATRPSWSLISAGFMNQWNHPHPDVLDRYRSFGSSILTTAECGMVQLVISEQGVQRRCIRKNMEFPDVYPKLS